MISCRIIGVAALCVLVSSSTVHADDWKKHKGNCDKVLKSHATVVMVRLKECVGMWMAYVDPNTVKPKSAKKLKVAFQSLYARGLQRKDEDAENLAIMAAERLGVRLQLVLKTESAGVGNGRSSHKYREAGSATASRRKKFVAPKVSRSDRSQAKKHVKRGIKYFKQGRRGKSLAEYKKALLLDPGNLDALYNAAAEYGNMRSGEECVDHLQKLVDVGSRAALKRLNRSRTDPDFEPLYDYVPYKRVSGYARTKLVNSLGEFGEDELDRIEKTMTKLEYPVSKVGVDKVKNRKTPVIWFKNHSMGTAYMLREILVHPGTVMTKITWDSDYDIIVSWGNKLVVRNGVKQPQKDYTSLDPDEAEKRLDKLRHKQDKVLRKPESVARKVNRRIETPKRIGRKVEGSIDRTKRTVETIEKTSEKVNSVFK